MSRPIVIEIPSLRDNYAYLVICPETRAAAVVDPSEATKVTAAASEAGVTLTAILNTHHHWDHTAGNKDLLKQQPTLTVYGHRSDEGRIAGQTVLLEEGHTLAIGDCEARVMHIPGHTTGAVAYVFDGLVFTGDTLFNSGCGRLFEGTPEMMFESLTRLTTELPPETAIYNGHEYTLGSLAFARAAEPDNTAMVERTAWAQSLRDAGKPTLPSTVADELATNPFVRAGSAEKMGELRSWKDNFKG